ncbi:signal peptide protein [Ectobacillus antri]|jgi:hypothetical protein|uniref:Signal peptide protein n=1 Tax=Ectobacillus antri TaxID=2486280 RepID=A0ABT6H6A4_9BACI|nr:MULTISPECIES: hypothetical protein [Ectobacillus]MDG4657377.1 signal peptide protein [Ectobacillus antri]MDG5754492.1 signal peptide protein [Ectobacillus antri]UOY91910.1 signal peptide protein [Ectobacillus sp. JY-23]
MLDVMMVGAFILLTASMAGLAKWSDNVVKEGNKQ